MSERVFGAEGAADAARRSRLQRLLREALVRRLRKVEHGALTLQDPCFDEGAALRFGDPSAETEARIFVRSPGFYSALAARGAVGGAESYIDGEWGSDDLAAVIRVLARNASVAEGLNGGSARLARAGLHLFHRLHRNTRRGSRRNIAAHYDLGDDFYELFLDPTLTYSSGVFERPNATMEEASVAKYERLCRKLDLSADDHVLEIGTGWGGFAIHAARTRGCRVTTTTISENQFAVARRRVQEAGLSSRVEVCRRDYRDLTGTYDKLVSIEMIEAVGAEYLEEFFAVCDQRLAADGVMALQAITIPDRDFEAHCNSVDFIKRYIFPGGNLVSIGAMGQAAAAAGELRVTHLEDLAPHYAETLRRWRDRFSENLEKVAALGFDEKFQRMWEFYLCYCEGGFDERQIGLVQVVLEKSGTRRPALLGAL